MYKHAKGTRGTLERTTTALSNIYLIIHSFLFIYSLLGGGVVEVLLLD